MSTIFITGSADGLGQMAAARLVERGHDVILHARSQERARDALRSTPGARDAIIGDLSDLTQMRSVADQANARGRFDAVIHNAAVSHREPQRLETVDGFAHVFAVNAMAPYVLTSLMRPPGRLVYLSSGLHRGGDPSLEDLQWRSRSWNGLQAYSDSKLFVVTLALAVARHWPEVLSNAVEPGWVATKMGGPHAPDDLSEGAETQVWLATSEEPEATSSGGCFYHKRHRAFHPAAGDADFQERFLGVCEQPTGVTLPEPSS